MGKQISIAVVDDDTALCSALRFSLEIDGYAVSTYPTASDLLADRCQKPDCLIVDQRLPDMSGVDLLQRLRALENDTPAVLMTSHPTRDLRSAAATMDIAIVEKPLLGNALLEEIQRVTDPGRLQL